MSVVVERGLARCPRCVAVADYTFVESGPNSVRYEVHCGRCGEAYCEVHSPMTPDFTAAVDALVVPPPLALPSVFELRRRRGAAWFAETVARVSAAIKTGWARIVDKTKTIRR
ncbi:hypothetical protein TUM20985_01300 [Mycobacterium antarcticum]|uniref:hypothetical protein n=1 Tax=Mycolicibacterium sp. TUM20985 TaxID=3023370 RepID=UPI0025734FAA|nr:hypothetical protein [Mycolicibacterium sp. TUM20985]BDX29583.1 hypothetical protein TUM20985_01300 [Mycolicibacterium sp. TUM20985]